MEPAPFRGPGKSKSTENSINYRVRFFGLTILILTLAASSCREMKEPEFKGIRQRGIAIKGMDRTVWKLVVDYYNPNSFTGKLRSGEGHAWLDSMYLGRFQIDTAINVPARADFSIPVSLVVQTKDLLKHTMAAFMKNEMTVTIKGKLRAGRKGFYKNIPIDYKSIQDVKTLFQ